MIRAICFAAVLGSASTTTAANLLCCGAEEIFIIDLAQPGTKKWTWRASDAPEIPGDWHKKFLTTDECKPYSDDLLLVTSSSGGVALIKRESKKCLFLAEARNAHSACLLPNGEIVVAASTGGDALVFFDRDDSKNPAQAKHQIPLKGAHGAVFDEKSGALWALGDDELLILRRKEAMWEVEKRWNLPSPGGHDLSDAGDGKRLMVTTNTEVFFFSKDNNRFEKHPVLGDLADVKSVDRHATSGKIVYHQAAKPHWWSEILRFVDGEPIQLKGEHLYKVRWDSPVKIP